MRSFAAAIHGVVRHIPAQPTWDPIYTEPVGQILAFADRTSAQEVQVAIAAKPDSVEVGFWRAALGYAPVDDDNAVDPLGHGSTVWMQELDADKPLRHAMHVDVSVAREQVEARVAAALAAGGRIVDGADAPGSWILADRAGNRLCICAWPDGSTLSAPVDPQ